MQTIPQKIRELVEQRELLRRQKRYKEGDEIRERIGDLGYEVEDTEKGMRVFRKSAYVTPKKSFLVLFGSGEIAPSAQKVHDRVLRGIAKDKPNVVILSTPAGFQPNVKVVCEEIKSFFERHLKNYHPRVEILYANTLEQSNNSTNVQFLDNADYIFAGPGSPTYAVGNLRGSLLLTKITERVRAGASVGLSSAAAIAFSRFALPVYEIYKAGFDLYWENGLDFYTEIFSQLTVITHFNNNEGGKKNDTSRAWMGKQRFEELFAMLPKEKKLWGIDEHTAVLINLQTKKIETLGKGKLWQYNT